MSTKTRPSAINPALWAEIVQLRLERDSLQAQLVAARLERDEARRHLNPPARWLVEDDGDYWEAAADG